MKLTKKQLSEVIQEVISEAPKFRGTSGFANTAFQKQKRKELRAGNKPAAKKVAATKHPDDALLDVLFSNLDSLNEMASATTVIANKAENERMIKRVSKAIKHLESAINEFSAATQLSPSSDYSYND